MSARDQKRRGKTDFSELYSFVANLEQKQREFPGGIVCQGPAAKYALVWEWGNTRQTRQGPRTVRGINPRGERVWLSSQAPYGYIRINEPQFFNILSREMESADLTVKGIKKALLTASEHMAELVKNSAPVDTGMLASSIRAARPSEISEDGNDLSFELEQ